MVDVRVETMPERPGHARIIVAPLPAPAAAPGILIKREGYQEANLGYRGWQVREDELVPLEVEAVGEATALVVGPQVSRHLEPAPYILEIPSLGIHSHLHWPDDIDVFDGDLPPERRYEQEVQTGAVAQPPEQPVEPAPVRETEKEKEKTGPTLVVDPRVKPESRQNRRPLYIVGGLLLLLIIAGTAAWFAFPDYRPWQKPGQKDEAADKTPPAPAPVPSPPSTDQAGRPPSGPVWPDGTDAMTPVEVVKHASSGEAIFAVAQRRMQAGKYEDALVLFEQAADRGSVPAFKALAQLYDPNGFEPGKPFRNPDFRTAASYYKEAVAHGDSDATAPREALRQRLEKDAREGNGMAASALKEFWP